MKGKNARTLKVCLFQLTLICNFLIAPVFYSNAQADNATNANGNDAEDWNIHYQSTYIAQWKKNFNSPYFGSKSLLNNSEGDIAKSYTLTATAFMGRRIWQGTEIYYNPEVFQGIPFSSLTGLGGFTNSELQKGTDIPAIQYTARAFIRQTFGLGGGVQFMEDGVNQLSGNVDTNRIVITYGAFAATDYFDQNAYSHDGRTQFMNWAIAGAGAYDYAANSQGFTFGLVGEFYTEDWVIRAARLALPYSPNTLNLDYNMNNDYEHNIELTHSHTVLGQPGKLRILAFRNTGLMANYQNAINQGIQTNSTPNILTSRFGTQTKLGYLINAEQAITPDVGLFSRLSWNDGQSESISYDICKSISGGVAIKGSIWSRPQDTFGAAFAINGLSAAEIEYLQRGGVTMMIGDGALNYNEERIIETYYNFKVTRWFSLSGDYQRINNPGYNAARGPVNFVGIRAHIDM